MKTLSVCYVKAVLSTEPASTGRHCFTSVISSLLCHVKSLICYVKTLWLLCEGGGLYGASKHRSSLFHVCHIFTTVLCEDIVSVM